MTTGKPREGENPHRSNFRSYTLLVPIPANFYSLNRMPLRRNYRSVKAPALVFQKNCQSFTSANDELLVGLKRHSEYFGRMAAFAARIL